MSTVVKKGIMVACLGLKLAPIYSKRSTPKLVGRGPGLSLGMTTQILECTRRFHQNTFTLLPENRGRISSLRRREYPAADLKIGEFIGRSSMKKFATIVEAQRGGNRAVKANFEGNSADVPNAEFDHLPWPSVINYPADGDQLTLGDWTLIAGSATEPPGVWHFFATSKAG